jgi:CotH kinase protein
MTRARRLAWPTILLPLSVACLHGCGSSSEDAARNGPTSPLPEPKSDFCSIALTCEDEIQDEPKVDCQLAITEELGVSYQGITAIERRGRSSLQYDKPNYSFELRDSDGSNNPVDLMGMGEDEDWILDGSWIDRSFVRNQLVNDLFSSFSSERFAPQGRFCELLLNDEYQGIYRLVERIKRADSRLNLPADDGSGSTFVIEQDPDGELRFALGLEDNWSTDYPKEPSDAQRDGIQRFLDQLDRALARRSDDPEEGVFSLLDRNNVIDWIIIQELSRNVDAYKLSVYLYRSQGKHAALVPWDFDLSMGQPTIAQSAPEPSGGDKSAGWVLERTAFIDDIIAVPGVPEALAKRWRELRQTTLATDVVLGQIDLYVAVIEDSVAANFERWPLQRVRFESIYPPYSLYPVTSYADEIAKLKTWLEERLVWIDANVDSFEAGSN